MMNEDGNLIELLSSLAIKSLKYSPNHKWHDNEECTGEGHASQLRILHCLHGPPYPLEILPWTTEEDQVLEERGLKCGHA